MNEEMKSQETLPDKIKHKAMMEAAEELTAIAEDLDTIGIFMDAWLQALKNDAPTEETLESMRCTLGRWFDDMPEKLSKISEIITQ